MIQNSRKITNDRVVPFHFVIAVPIIKLTDSNFDLAIIEPGVPRQFLSRAKECWRIVRHLSLIHI